MKWRQTMPKKEAKIIKVRGQPTNKGITMKELLKQQRTNKANKLT